MRPASGTAPARAALAGNPSDGYGGRTLAVTLDAWWAHVDVGPVGRHGFDVDASSARAEAAGAGREAFDVDAAIAAGGGDALVAAAARRLRRAGLLGDEPFTARWSSTIPRQVGLAGSSALVVAALRALCTAAAIELAPDELALCALEAETEELGIAAGPQDRVAQAYGDLVAMDFAPAHGPIGRAERLDRALLPPLFIAWQQEPAASSGVYHAELRRRHATGDPELRRALAELADHAAVARDALVAGDHDAFRRCLDGSFDARRRLGPLEPDDVAMIELVRAHGASANYAGSGGAIVGTLPTGLAVEALRDAFARRGCGLIEIGS